MNKPIVKVKLLPGGKMPEKKSAGAAAWDCYARIKNDWGNFIDVREATCIPLGFALELPPGYHAEIYPRSSTGLKTRLRVPNSVGIIDSDYRGEVKFIAESNDIQVCSGYGCSAFASIASVEVKNGDRIAQMLIKKDDDVDIVQVDELSETERGTGGFGSTGTR